MIAYVLYFWLGETYNQGGTTIPIKVGVIVCKNILLNGANLGIFKMHIFVSSFKHPPNLDLWKL
jgi:hypothetical protein